MATGAAASHLPPGPRVLVRLPNWLGDVLLARPLLHALGGLTPRAALFGVAPAPLLEILAPEARFAATAAWGRDARSRRACLDRAKRFRAEAALVLPPSFSSAWFAWRSGAPRRIGYAGDGRGPLLSRALGRPARGHRHLSDEYLALAVAAGLVAAGPAAAPPDLAAPAGAQVAAQALLADHPSLADRPRVLLGPGATYGPAKQWGAARFAALGRALQARGYAVIVCGTAGEAALCATVAREAGAVSLAGKTGLAELTELAAHAALAVCNDSGLAHLAAATGTPTVVVFGSTSSAWTAPVGRRVRIVQQAPVCSPCFRRTCRIGYPCLGAVTVDAVLGTALEAAA